jgi:hypothetical protein
MDSIVRQPKNRCNDKQRQRHVKKRQIMRLPGFGAAAVDSPAAEDYATILIIRCALRCFHLDLLIVNRPEVNAGSLSEIG